MPPHNPHRITKFNSIKLIVFNVPAIGFRTLSHAFIRISKRSIEFRARKISPSWGNVNDVTLEHPWKVSCNLRISILHDGIKRALVTNGSLSLRWNTRNQIAGHADHVQCSGWDNLLVLLPSRLTVYVGLVMCLRVIFPSNFGKMSITACSHGIRFPISNLFIECTSTLQQNTRWHLCITNLDKSVTWLLVAASSYGKLCFCIKNCRNTYMYNIGNIEITLWIN